MNHIPPTLPKQITILGKKVKVIVIHDHDNPDAGSFEGDTITINTVHNDNNYDLWHSYLHEVLHASLRRIGVHHAIPTELEEVIVDSLATMLMECFQLTPR